MCLRIQSGLSPLFPVFHLLPDRTGVGHLLRQVEPFTRYSVELSKCAELLFNGVQPVIAMMQDKSVPTDVAKIISALSSQSAVFHQAQKYYQSAADIRPALDPSVLPSSIKIYYDKLDANFDMLGFGLDLFQVLPGLAGQDQSKVYLVLAQNYDEIRATGGFISGVGTIEVAAGKIKKFDMGDSYRIDDFSKDYPWPPMPIQRFMLGEYWVTRDANWSPDFPTAAQKAQEFYTLSTNQKTDGVIAFDQEAVRQLVALYGPINMPSFNFPVTAQNVEQYMHDAWAPDNPAAITNEWWLHRKDFMKEMGSELLSKMIATRDVDRLMTLAWELKNLVSSGHLLVYFNAPEAESVFNKTDLSGAVDFQNNPSFLLVDSNIGFNKMDSVIKRSMDIQLDISDLTQPVATITVNYENPVKKTVACVHTATYGDGTYADMQNRCYWDYFRIYLPAGSELISISSPDIPAEWLLNHELIHNPVEVSKGEGNSVVVGGMVVVPTNSKVQIVLKVRLPQPIMFADTIGQQHLNMKIYKQPGLHGLPLNVSVVIPSNYQACQNSNSAVDKAGSQFSWKETITETFKQNVCLSSSN